MKKTIMATTDQKIIHDNFRRKAQFYLNEKAAMTFKVGRLLSSNSKIINLLLGVLLRVEELGHYQELLPAP